MSTRKKAQPSTSTKPHAKKPDVATATAYLTDAADTAFDAQHAANNVVALTAKIATGASEDLLALVASIHETRQNIESAREALYGGAPAKDGES